MPLKATDLKAYRKDERFGHRLMTAEERIRLLKPYLPTPPPQRSAKRATSKVREGRKERLGVRRLLRRSWHILVFTIVHFFFSLYVRSRQAYHMLGNRFYSVYHHHHHSPELIQKDIKGLSRLPKHLSVILTLEEGRSGAGLEKLVNEAADVAAWCASAGIPQLSIYEKTGILKGYVKETHHAMSEKLKTYFGPSSYPSVTLGAPHVPQIQSGLLSHGSTEKDRKNINIILLSAEDGRDSIVDLTKTLAEMSQRKKIQTADITTELIDAELSESVMSEPDLLILFTPHVELAGYPPWQIRLTEIFHVRDNQGVGYQVFYRGLCKFARAQMQTMGSQGAQSPAPHVTDKKQEDEDIMSALFRVPAVRSGTAALNRALFDKKVDIAAAVIRENKLLSEYRKALVKSDDILKLDRISPIRGHPDSSLADKGAKCLLLHPRIKVQKAETWGPVIQDAVQKGDVNLIPYELRLNYDYYSFRDIMESILPEDLHDEIPGGFNVAGHVAHLNLRKQYLPYKSIIAEVLQDKNPHIKTVINKVDDVGAESEFRTFQYEVLAGPGDLNVTLTENGCVFEFDYSKVYWNSKLETEHTRLVKLFEPGAVVCDVMGGIGPFAVPAGKKGVFVWANDKNPESYKYLKAAVERNRVEQFVRPFNADGLDFIHQAADSVLAAHQNQEKAVVITKKKAPQTTTEKRQKKKSPPVLIEEKIPVPATIGHFVMNLPASAIEFLGAYRGVYSGRESLFSSPQQPLPLVHVYCFSFKPDNTTGTSAQKDICERITKTLGYPVKLVDDKAEEKAINEGEVVIRNVRNVSPNKWMYCASFRLPAEVAFAPRE
ncbi:putative undecaprenyl pyrophosphate protein [Podospora australis]|uniref:tRNA (guanine(37)-N1)-methyltransferase n=1 Tax=Podospora australis TaxID=1536484 RepID=A0AAN7AM65_9PEZI|nr:putative undecaprenyl pyrophosphate protein [Podospora australis]